MMYYVFEGVGDDGFVEAGAESVEGVKVIDEMEFYTIVKYDPNTKKQSIETTEDSVADL